MAQLSPGAEFMSTVERARWPCAQWGRVCAGGSTVGGGPGTPTTTNIAWQLPGKGIKTRVCV